MKRRSFLRQSLSAAGFVSATLGLPGIGRVGSPPRLPLVNGEVNPRDEAFWSLVRQQFPLTRDRIYLNNAGLGPSPYPAIEALQQEMWDLQKIGEAGRTKELWRSIKQAAAEILGCTAEEIAYTRNATEGINIVCHGLPLRRGDEVITTSHEHVGNTIAWLVRQENDGIVMKVFEPSTRSAQENLDRIESLITPRTRAISIPHVTTTTGQILPVREIGDLARKHQLWYFVDGAQSAGMMPVNVHEIGCHAFTTSGHKWLLGPTGTGLLFVRQAALEAISATWTGAYSNTGEFSMRTGKFQLHPTAQRYEYGTVSTPQFVGLGAAMRFLLGIGMKNVWQRNLALATVLKDGLADLGVEVLSPQKPGEHSSIITFRMPNASYQELFTFFGTQFKLRVRGVYEAGLDAIRISLNIYNSFQEIETVLEAVQAAKKL